MPLVKAVQLTKDARLPEERLGESVKITQVTVKNANMFDDPMGPKRKEYQRAINQLKQSL